MYALADSETCIMSRDLREIASTLVARGKGILAADETVPTLTRRFDALGIPSTEQSRRTTGNVAGTALNYETMKRALSLRRAHKA